MPVYRHREETINNQLAILISGLGIQAEAETILFHGKDRPDVIFDFRGLRVTIEGKFSDVQNARKTVLEQARDRVQKGISNISAAIVYPKALRNAPSAKLLKKLESTSLAYCIASEADETEWFKGLPIAIIASLRRVQDSLAQDDIVEKTAKSLSERLEAISHFWIGQSGTCDRLANILGMPPSKGETAKKREERHDTAAKVAALAIANALIFQEQLASTDGRVKPLNKVEKEKDIISEFQSTWQWIWQNIDYVPIFQLGERLLSELPLNRGTINAFKELLEEAKSICSHQSALRHDLMGRVYHWLLYYAKYLGTYYTSVSSATLLLKLALSAKWDRDFGDPMQLSEFKIADLACGTGTLLMAAAQAVSDSYIRTRSETGRSLNPVDLWTLHRTIMENVIYGYDVLPSAVHLTASTLAMLAPEVAFVRMNLFVMPMGIDKNIPRLGSLDFLGQDRARTQLSLDNSQAESVQTGVSGTRVSTAFVPKLDLCVMNPPFVRSVGGNLLFGSLPDERGKLQTELKKRVKNIDASITAGLGSVFVALADKHLKEDGRLAFVLPAALASGEAWKKTRKLISDKYHLETVISSHDAKRPNFSENTDLSEILFIARKRKPGETPFDTTFINLWRSPRSIHEAMDVAARLSANKPTSINDAGITTIKADRGKLAEMASAPPPDQFQNWTGALFAQTELLRAFVSLKAGVLKIPGDNALTKIPLCSLYELGELGYDQRDIHDAFTVSKDDWSPYPAFWNHTAKKVKKISQEKNANLIARVKPPKGRKIKDAVQVWSKSGRILLAERVRTNTHSVLALGFSDYILGNTWWTFRNVDFSENHEKVTLLWLNSTLSILLFFGCRVITQGAWMKMKKPAWKSMPVLDVRALNKAQLKKLSSVYDKLANKELKALAELDKDPVRTEIDNALSKTLGLPDLKNISELLAREPGLTGKPIV